MRCQREQINRAADTHHDIAECHRHCGSNHLFDHCCITGHAAGDFGGAVLFEKGRALAKEVAIYRDTNIGNRAFPKPRYEVKTECGRYRHDGHDQQQIFEPACDIVGVAADCKSAVDNQPEPRRDRKRRQCSHGERKQRECDLPRISRCMLPNHEQIAQFLCLGRGVFGLSHDLGRCALNLCGVGHGARLAGTAGANNEPKTGTRVK